jgi:hypothetical protein
MTAEHSIRTRHATDEHGGVLFAGAGDEHAGQSSKCLKFYGEAH